MDLVNAYIRKIPIGLVYALALTPAIFLIHAALTGGLGIDPVKKLEHELGKLALQMLIFGLAITPLRRWAGVNLIRFRRCIGVVTYVYLCFHLLVWLVLDVQILDQIWGDILKRPYITIGMLGFVLLTPLALTSNNRSVRRLGPKWRQLHRLVYLAAVLGGLHYFMLVKGFQLEPILYLTVIIGLLLLRVVPARRIQAA
ncbi:protein-methionine-sulfoxide reductase heme-binding subunit MsrQ [Primorskyibacter sp. S87]|uniref:protein-methionine-sulfoxide reductase heme-binding subunit MsrQ n=1 Tax=Primorskyibacter sp. S87 TaxID=3415126 RepID=UPI003C7CF5FB